MTREEKLKEKYELMSAFEKECASEGMLLCCGIDEAGRGPLAGPVVASACILDPEKPIYGLDDSKKLSPKKRDQLYDEIVEKAKAFCIIRVEPKEIDAINILEATKNAMRAAVKGLVVKPDVLLIDAVNLSGTGIPVKPIIKGDATPPSRFRLRARLLTLNSATTRAIPSRSGPTSTTRTALSVWRFGARSRSGTTCPLSSTTPTAGSMTMTA